MLDIEVAAAVAPGANIVVYFTPNTDQGFIDAIATAVHDTKNKPSVISISWGGPESTWTAQSMTALDAACQSAAALGITITVAAGDNGSTDGVTDGANHVDFPASSPHVLACGGTKLQGSGSTHHLRGRLERTRQQRRRHRRRRQQRLPSPHLASRLQRPQTHQSPAEAAASPTSPATPTPPPATSSASTAATWSSAAPAPSRLSGPASSPSPTPRTANPPASFNPPSTPPKAKAAFRDITSGTNYSGTPVGFTAGPGWDACTGLGSPIGTKLIAVVNPGGAAPSAKTKKKAAKKAVKKAAKKKKR